MATTLEFSALFSPFSSSPYTWTPPPRQQKQPKQPKQKPTSPNFLQSSNSNSNSNIASSPKQPSAVQKKLKQIAHKLGHAWKLHLPPPPASSPTTKSSSQKSTSTSTNK